MKLLTRLFRMLVPPRCDHVPGEHIQYRDSSGYVCTRCGRYIETWETQEIR